jgi:hypothetical protein
MILDSDAPIPQNSLDGIPLAEQDWEDYRTGEILVSGIIARTDARCSAPSESFAEFGPVIQSTVADSLAAQSNLSIQSAASQNALNQAAGSGAVITDEELASAPVTTTLGSTPVTGGPSGGQSVYTDAQIAAATNHPVNWAKTHEFRPNRPSRHLSNSRVGALIGGGAESSQGWKTGGHGQRGPGGNFPAGNWGQLAAQSCGSGIHSFPYGKLLLFTGLGLIGVGILSKKR